MGAMRFCFLLFCLFLVSVSSVRKLNTIDDLRNTGYGRPRPRHGLQLLYWFALNVNVDQNSNRISLNFNPRNQDYGFHRFENREGILPSLTYGESYYEVGNLNYRGANALPEYVQMYRNFNQPERNMDRLIIFLYENRYTPISRVFITSHNRNRNDFNPSDTYEIDPALILQIREIVCNDDVISRITQRNNEDDKTEENGCHEFLTQTGYSSNYCKKRDNRRRKRSPYSQCSAYEGIKLEIKTTKQGYSKLIWENIPADLMEKYNNIYIDICQNTHSSDPNEDPVRVTEQYIDIHTSSGALDTSVYLNAGLQPRLRIPDTSYISNNPDIWYGPEFDGANRVIPIRIKGFDASLQLYAEDGKACARLYIKKTFRNWEDVLEYSNSWIGFYKSSQDNNDGYDTYQYAVEFTKMKDDNTKDYDIYNYKSGLVIAPGVQIRFLLDKEYNKVLAQTTPWESDEKVTSICDKGNLWPKLSSSWSYPEFFYEPEFYDANNAIPIKIQKYEAGLLLFTKNGKACARLYIKKTFTDWKVTFYDSWVGFYTSSQNKNDDYYTYQYAVKFKELHGTKDFYFCQYNSELDIASGVQIRFMMDKGYDKKLVETEPWKSG